MILSIPILPPFFIDDAELGRVKVRGALLARKNNQIYAYANVCRHVPLTLDLGDGEVASANGTHFLCHHHGARYRIEDGHCEYGPCDGRSLIALEVVVEYGELIVVVPT